MKALKNCIKLSCSVKIYVPSTINVEENFDSQEWVEKALQFLSERFGGSTASKALGAWVSTEGKLIKESVTMVFAYATQDALEKYIEETYEFCIDMKSLLKQEAIALEINNELYLL